MNEYMSPSYVMKFTRKYYMYENNTLNKKKLYIILKVLNDNYIIMLIL